MKRFLAVFLLIGTLALPLPSLQGQRKSQQISRRASYFGRAKGRGPDYRGSDARLLEFYRFRTKWKVAIPLHAAWNTTAKFIG